MLEDALRYPFRGEDSTETLLVGGALPFLAIAIYLVGLLLTFVLVGFFVLPLAIVPRIFLWGYLVTVVAALLVGREEPPGFRDWKRLGVDGLKAIVVAFGYSIPLVVLFVALAAVVIPTSVVTEELATAPTAATAGATADAMVGVLFLLFGLAAALYSLLLYYVLPAAIVNFVREDDLGAAFHLRTVADIAFDGDYLVAWLLAAVVLTVGNLVAIPLYVVLVGFVLRFYLMVVAAYLVTHGSMKSMGWTPSGDDGTTPDDSDDTHAADVETNGVPDDADPDVEDAPGDEEDAGDREDDGDDVHDPDR